MSFLKKFLPTMGLILSLSAFAAEEKSLIPLSDDPLDDNSLARLFEQQLIINPPCETELMSDSPPSSTITLYQKNDSFYVKLKTCSPNTSPKNSTIYIPNPPNILMNLNKENFLLSLWTENHEKPELKSLQEYNYLTPDPKELSIKAIDFNIASLEFISPVFLKTLSLFRCNIQGNISLRTSQELSPLEEIKIISSSLYSEGIDFLKTVAPGLKKLQVENCDMSPLEFLPVLEKLSSLEELTVICTIDKMPREAVNFLLHKGDFPFLTSLHLERIKLSTSNPTDFFDAKNLQTIRHLSLPGTDLSDSHLSNIFQRYFFYLETLNLAGNKFTTEGVKKMEDSNILYTLKKFDLTYAKLKLMDDGRKRSDDFTEEDLQAFYAAVSNWEIKNNSESKINIIIEERDQK